jgi:hypothetical protein
MNAGRRKALFLSHTLSPAGDITAETVEKGSFLASVRLQLLPALRAAEALGMQTQVLALRSEKPEQLQLIGTPELCVIGKLSHPNRDFQARIAMANLAAVARLRRKRVPLLVIYSDNLASQNSLVGLMYRDLLDAATAVVVPCAAMVPFARNWMRPERPCTVIEDPLQVSRQPFPQLRGDEPVRLVWFGHASNLRYLLQNLPALLSGCKAWCGYELTVLSDVGSIQECAKRMREVSTTARPWRLRPVPWRTEKQPIQLEEELRRAHLALLPSDPTDPRKAAVSHNRAADALQAGCIVIASPLSSYQELAEGLLLGSNQADLVDEACRNYAHLSSKYTTTRQGLLKRLAPARNLDLWRTALKSLGSTS